MSRLHHRWSVVAVVLLVSVAPALAADWDSIGIDADGNRYSIDRDGILREGGRIKAWVRADYATPREDATSDGPVFAAIDRLVVDCTHRSFALESRSYVGADAQQRVAIAAAREQLEFRVAVPGSMSEKVVRRLCSAVGPPVGDGAGR